jgi:hypothetical protein
MMIVFICLVVMSSALQQQRLFKATLSSAKFYAPGSHSSSSLLQLHQQTQRLSSTRLHANLDAEEGEYRLQRDAMGQSPVQALERKFALPRGTPTFTIAALIAWNSPIPPSDMVFCLIYPIYLSLANKFRFRSNADAIDKPYLPLLRKGGKVFY